MSRVEGPIEHLERLREQLAEDVARNVAEAERYEAEAEDLRTFIAEELSTVDEINSAIVALRKALA
jgi:glucose-6-phosphate-specific signal transduction histidine kinase